MREKITLEVIPGMLTPDKLDPLHAVFAKLEAQLKSDGMQSEKAVEWSSYMTTYEIMLMEQAILIFQNAILQNQSRKVLKGKDHENKETE